MKYLNWLSILLFITGNFSCGDQKSTEEIASKPAVQKEKVPAQNIPQDPLPNSSFPEDSIVNMQKDSMISVVKIDSTNKDSKKELALDDSVLTATEAKSTNLFAPIPPELKDHVQLNEIPTAAEVGIRPYPNSYVIKLNPKTEYRGKTYVTIELGSPDDPEKVLQFYQKWKDDWFFMGGEGIYTFKQEQDKYFRETNTLQILSFNNDLHVEISSLLTIKPQTLIRIYYESK